MRHQNNPIMKKIALIFFLLAATGAFAQDLLVPESYGIYGYDGYNELILNKLLPPDKNSYTNKQRDAIGALLATTPVWLSVLRVLWT